MMLTMMIVTMTMMTIGRRYEYTRSNDRMWRKNTVAFLMICNDADHRENEDNDTITTAFYNLLLDFLF